MTPVVERQEYERFDRDVRQPGLAFLRFCPEPNNREYRKHEYWSRSLPSLREAYGGVCAYTSFYMPSGVSLDHFVPKAHCPTLAYEWSNFRLCDPRVNGWKSSRLNIVDPFKIRPGWFTLMLPACIVRPGTGLSRILVERIRQTIQILRLNDDEAFVEARFNLLRELAQGHIDLEFLKRYNPFIGNEVERQGGVATIRTMIM